MPRVILRANLELLRDELERLRLGAAELSVEELLDCVREATEAEIRLHRAFVKLEVAQWGPPDQIVPVDLAMWWSELVGRPTIGAPGAIWALAPPRLVALVFECVRSLCEAWGARAEARLGDAGPPTTGGFVSLRIGPAARVSRQLAEVDFAEAFETTASSLDADCRWIGGRFVAERDAEGCVAGVLVLPSAPPTD